MSAMPRVLILSGGISHERDISLKSGRKVADGLTSHGMSVELRDPDGTLIEHLRDHPPEVVWPVLHGASGEDGALRALLEMLGIPFVGSSANASRIAWNKPVAKSLVERAGVASPPLHHTVPGCIPRIRCRERTRDCHLCFRTTPHRQASPGWLCSRCVLG